MAGTAECQIAKTNNDGSESFFIDTPGFDDEATAWGVFLKIMEMIDRIRTHSYLIGVWYVVDNSGARASGFETKFIDWLAEFCGAEYYSHITFVTTRWRCTDVGELQELENGLEQRKGRWATFLARGAETYQHGKVYINGVETSQAPTLSWHRYRATIAVNAQAMALQRCRGLDAAIPRIIRELGEGKAVEETAAANVLRPATGGPSTTAPQLEEPSDERPDQTESSSGDSANGTSQSEGSSQAGESSQGPGPKHMPPLSQSEGVETNPQDEPHWFVKWVCDGVKWVVQNVSFNVSGNGFSAGTSGGNAQFHFGSSGPFAGSSRGAGMGSAGRRLNTDTSIKDIFESLGLPSDRDSRAEMAQFLNIPGTPGTYDHNVAFVREMHRRHPNI